MKTIEQLKTIESLEGVFSGIPAFVIGNAVHRRIYDISELGGRGIIFGCNKFCIDPKINLRGFPVFSGASDPGILNVVCKNKAWERYNIIVRGGEERANSEISEESVFKFPELYHYLGEECYWFNAYAREKWTSCGDGMIHAACLLGCSPIFILGFGDVASDIKVDLDKTIYCDNMYADTLIVRANEYRKYDSNQKKIFVESIHSNKNIEEFTDYSTNFRDLERPEKVQELHKNEDLWAGILAKLSFELNGKMVRIGNHGKHSFIPWVPWDDVINKVPVRYRLKKDSYPWAPEDLVID